MEKIVGIICFIFFGLGFIVALIKFIFKKQRDKQTIKALIGGIIMLAMSIYLINIDDTKSSPEVSNSSTIQNEKQEININAPIPEQIDEHIKKVVDKNDYINVEVNEHMGRNDDTKMVLVYVKAHGYKTYKSALINATKVFKELYTSQLPIGEVCIFFKGDFTDKYGNQSEQTAIKIIMDLNTAQNINWQNFDWRNLPSITNSVYVHPGIDKNE